MAENEWGGLEAKFVTSLREVRVEPVPEPIVKLAQRALDGAPHPDDPERVIHAMEITFETPEKAAAFAKHMRNAGLHTKPLSSITVIQDPESQKVAKLDDQGRAVVNENGRPVMVPGAPVNPRKVAFRVGERRGRKAS